MTTMLLFRIPLVLLLLFFIPAVLVATGLVPFAFRLPVLLLIFFAVLVYSFFRGFTLAELGIRKDNLVASLKINLVISLVCFALLALLFRYGLISGPLYPVVNVFVPFYFLVSSPLQEFLFRGFLFAEMRASGIRQAWQMIVVSAVSFSFIHIIYGDLMTVALTFGIGLVWSAIYYRVPNLAGVSFSHAIIGFLALLWGIARKM